ncbi:MAG: hypothetical protein ACJ8KU_00835, partial [Chthoniobacterales bacterium]
MIFNRSARFDAAIAYVIATVTCCGVTVICLHLWQANLRYPLQYGGGDELAVELFIKGLIENPWYFKNSSLAMPFGQDLSALPLPDAFNLSLLKLIGFCTHGYGRVINMASIMGHISLPGRT